MRKILEVLAEGKAELENIGSRLEGSNNHVLDVQNVLNWVYGIMGVVAVIFIVYSAVGYLTAQGDPNKIKKASQSIAFAVIGLAIILLAAAITTFVFNSINEAQK